MLDPLMPLFKLKEDSASLGQVSPAIGQTYRNFPNTFERDVLQSPSKAVKLVFLIVGDGQRGVVWQKGFWSWRITKILER